jgi:hypothetical protein
MLGGKDPPSAETPHPGGAIPDFSCTSILLSILYTATIHAYLVLHIVGSSDCDHHRVKIRVVVTNSFSNPNPRQSASSLVLNKLKFSRAFLCRRYLVPEPCGICLSACCRSPRMAVVSDFWRREAAGGPALRLPMNKMNAGGLL